MESSLTELLRQLYGHQHVTYLLYLLLANLVLGILASVRSGDFRLARVADWLWNRLVPMAVGYGVAAMLATVNADWVMIREIAFAALAGAMTAYILANLRDMGISGLPDVLAAKPPNETTVKIVDD